MKTINHILRLLILSLVLPLTSCHIDHYGNNVCDYSVRIRYYYNEENTATENRLPLYVNSIDEYIFDENGILVKINPLTKDVCDGTWHSDLDLQPGKYSVIAVGNRSAMSDIKCLLPELTPGETHRDYVQKTLDCSQIGGLSTAGQTDRLYHGYRTFSVSAEETSSVRVDMVHSHMVLRIVARWRRSAPAVTGDITMTVSGVPTRYKSMPEYYFPRYSCKPHDPADDTYPLRDNSVIHYIPFVDDTFATKAQHVEKSYLTADREVKTEFVSYRIRRTSQCIVTMSDSNGSLMNDVDLTQWFNDNNIVLDENLRQEFYLEFLINDDGSVDISPMEFEDWDEGGSI